MYQNHPLRQDKQNPINQNISDQATPTTSVSEPNTASADGDLLLDDGAVQAVKDVVSDAGRATTHKVGELAQAVKDTTAATTEHTTEVMREVAQTTGTQLEVTTNKTLEFLGFSVDVHTLLVSGVDLAIKLALALLVFFVGKWIGTRLVNAAKRIMKRSNMDVTAATFLGNVLYGLMLVAVALAALNQLGVNTNSFVAILGAATVAIGMSLKDQLSNLAAGVMIVMFRPFGRGDVVEVAGQQGTVMDITLVNTRIKTPNNHEIIIPNGDIMTNASINYSSLPNRRVEVLVGIGYENDINTARQIMLVLAKEHKLTLKEPEPIVRVTALSDSSVNLTLYVWAQNSDWFSVQCDLLEAIKYQFDDKGINIPFPQRSLHIEGLADLHHSLVALNTSVNQANAGNADRQVTSAQDQQ